MTVEEVTPRSVGALIALYERAVGIYASLVNINAYHQPGIHIINLICGTQLKFWINFGLLIFVGQLQGLKLAKKQQEKF